jgi:hypothetical protein
MDMAFIQIDIQHDDLSCTYLLPSDERADEVLKAIFTNASDFDGLLYRHEPYESRKAFSVPSITEVLEAFPKELNQPPAFGTGRQQAPASRSAEKLVDVLQPFLRRHGL